ncbi:MAG: hypothetical protein WBA15_08990 [Mesorhizobium sp.]
MARKQGTEVSAATAAAEADSEPGRNEEVGDELCAATTAAEPQAVGTKLHEIRFSLLEMVAYHAMREQFLSRFGKVLTALQVLLGTSAVATLTQAIPDATIWLVSLAALTGVLLLVLDPNAGAREHRILRGRFHDLLADCEEQVCDDAMLRTIRAKSERIKAAAPPAYRALSALAYNTAVNAVYRDELAAKHRYRVAWYWRWLANWWPLRGVRFTLESVPQKAA